jgi:hypothetical protein
VKNSILIAKARVLVDLARYADAGDRGGGRTNELRMNATFSLTAGNNQIWALNASAEAHGSLATASTPAGLIKNAIPFASARDPARAERWTPDRARHRSGKSFDSIDELHCLNMYWPRRADTRSCRHRRAPHRSRGASSTRTTSPG